MIDLEFSQMRANPPVASRVGSGPQKTLAALAGLLFILTGDLSVFAQSSGAPTVEILGKTVPSPSIDDDCIDDDPALPKLAPPVGGPPATLVAETTITVDPRWRGEPVECIFDITNAGEGDLFFKPIRG